VNNIQICGLNEYQSAATDKNVPTDTTQGWGITEALEEGFAPLVEAVETVIALLAIRPTRVFQPVDK